MVDQVASAFGEITGTIDKVKALVTEVSTASSQQTQGIDQVSHAVSQMEQVTQSTAATAEESAAASEELNAQAETTMSLVRELQTMVGGGRAGDRVERPSSRGSFRKVLSLVKDPTAGSATAPGGVATGTHGSW
jgi:hypothetical protein